MFLMEREDVAGPVNCTSPNPVRNKELTAALGKTLGRPTFLPAVLSWVLKLVLGELGSVLLTGQKVLPKKLQEIVERSGNNAAMMSFRAQREILPIPGAEKDLSLRSR
jgi:NAD dependent epimerase/dehydratase family enzyme